MNTDIRISVSFLGHSKRKRLKIMLGANATDYLIDLWISTAMNHPNGILTGMDEIDIALCTGWDNDPHVLVGALMKCGFLDKDENGTYMVHDWEEHQPWVIHAPDRTAKAKHAANARWEGEKMKKNATSNATSMENNATSIENRCPYPSPIPSPNPLKNISTNVDMAESGNFEETSTQSTMEAPSKPLRSSSELQVIKNKKKKEITQKSEKGTRWASDRKVPIEWKEWAKKTCSNLNVDMEAIQFENYWVAKAGNNAIKLDWERTWQNWILKNANELNKPSSFKPTPIFSVVGNSTSARCIR